MPFPKFIIFCLSSILVLGGGMAITFLGTKSDSTGPPSPSKVQHFRAAEPKPQSLEEKVARILKKLQALAPAAAARWVECEELGSQRTEIMRTLAQRWAEQDSLAELAWAQDLMDPADRTMALETGCFFLAAKDGAGAVQLAAQAGLSGSVLGNLVEQWAAQDVLTAQAWVESQREDERQEWLVASLAPVLAGSMPETAAELVVSWIPAGPRQDEAVLGVLHQWRGRDPLAAKSWVALFPEGPLRHRAENLLR